MNMHKQTLTRAQFLQAISDGCITLNIGDTLLDNHGNIHEICMKQLVTSEDFAIHTDIFSIESGNTEIAVDPAGKRYGFIPKMFTEFNLYTRNVDNILERRAQEWWSKKSLEAKQVASTLYNFSGKLTIKEMYIEHQVAQYDKLARVSAIALQIAQSSKELGMTPEELMSPNGLSLMEAEKQYSKTLIHINHVPSIRSRQEKK